MLLKIMNWLFILKHIKSYGIIGWTIYKIGAYLDNYGGAIKYLFIIANLKMEPN